MEVIKGWAFALCAALIAGSMLRILMPGGNMQRVYSLTLSVFILCVILAPFFTNRPELRIEVNTHAVQEAVARAQILEDLVQEQSIRAAAYGVEKIVVSKLSEMGINHRGVTINMNYDGQNGHARLEAEILLGDEWQKEEERIVRELEEALKFPVALIFSQR